MKPHKRIGSLLLRSIVFVQLIWLPKLPSAQEVDPELVEYHLGQFSYFEYMDWDSAKMYLDSAIIAGEGSTDHMILGKIDLYQGWYYQDISEFDTSRAYFFKALDHYIQANSYNKIADVYGNLGNAFQDVGDLKNALDYQLKSLETNEQIILLSSDEQAIESAIRGRAYAWSNLSNTYKMLGQHRKSLQYEMQAMHYELENGDDSIGLGISYINIGTSYDDLGFVDSSVYFVSLAHGIFKRHEFANGLINSNIELYKFSEQDGQPQLGYLKDAYQLTREFEDHYSEVYVLGFLVSGDFGFSKDSLARMVKRGKYLIDTYDFEKSQFNFYKHEAENAARWGEFKYAYESLSRYLDLYSEQKEKNDGVDYENAELQHKYQLQSLEDSIAFEKTLNDHELKDQQRAEREHIITIISIGGGTIMAIFLLFLYRALKVRKRTNHQLSEKNIMIESQKELVEEKNQEIFDSITYAKRLQFAILPPVELIQEDFVDTFVYYAPKDVVSGDFYWYEQTDEHLFIAAADCTGHGVPGAMVSVVCSNALNRTVNEFGLTNTNEILNKTRELVISTFAKSGENVKDGMDISLCSFNIDKTNVQYSGANNPLWILRKNEYLTEDQHHERSTVLGEEYSLIEIKSDKQPVGLYEGMQDFTAKEIPIHAGDQFILFTDGYADQFGGDKGKKLKYKNLKQLLLANVNEPGKKQQEQLEDFMSDWIGDLEQVDDICIIGLKV